MKTHNRMTITLLALGALLALPAVARAADNYNVDPTHSTVIFKVKHFGVGFQYGSFRKVSGTLVVDEGKPARSSVSIDVDAASVFTANKKRDKHLRGPDFLNVKQFPKISFRSTKVRKSGKELKVQGKLTLHGVTKPITVRMLLVGKGKDAWGNNRIGFEGSFVVKRSNFGIAKMKGAVGEKLHMIVAVEGIKKK